MGLEDDTGLAEVLIGSTELAKVRRSVPGVPRLQVIGPGMVDAEEWVQAEALVDMLQQLQQERSAFIVVEAPPTSVSADTRALATLADVVILAVEGRQTLRRDVVDAAAELGRVGADVLGAVLVVFARQVIRQAGRRSSHPPAHMAAAGTTSTSDLGIEETMPISDRLAGGRRRVVSDVPRR